jgi:hypothetical protein
MTHARPTPQIVIRSMRRNPPDCRKLGRVLIALAIAQAEAEAEAQDRKPAEQTTPKAEETTPRPEDAT